MIAPHLQHNLAKAPPNSNLEHQAHSNPSTQAQAQPNPTPSPPHPPRPPQPAYLPTTPNSPLHLNRNLYTRIQSAPRTLLRRTKVPARSGLAVPIAAKSILRISTAYGGQVVDLNAFSSPNHDEHFWASRTRQLQSSHLTTFDRLWSNLPYMRPMLTMITDTLTARLSWPTAAGGRCHDLLGTRCDPYINHLLSSSSSSSSSTNDGSPTTTITGGQDFNYHCHSNLARAVLGFGIAESGVHDVLNLFQVTGLDGQGRYFMEPSPADERDYVEFFAEQDVLVALSTCPGGDLSRWAFGPEGERAMRQSCRPVQVEVFALRDPHAVLGGGGDEAGWREPRSPAYRGLHGMTVPVGEGVGDLLVTTATGEGGELGGREEAEESRAG